jgi:Fe-S-cluster containining protein
MNHTPSIIEPYHTTTCHCRACSRFCAVVPGYLIPEDLRRMAPRNLADPWKWVAEHLRASPGIIVGSLHPNATTRAVRYGTLVPARTKETIGSPCHWLDLEKHARGEPACRIHGRHPYGCAALDEHMSAADAEARRYAGAMRIVEAWTAYQAYLESPHDPTYNPNKHPDAAGLHYCSVWEWLNERDLAAPDPARARDDENA